MKNKLKLFPKLFMMTFITILSTILIFSFIFQFMYSSYINNYMKQQFLSSVSELERDLNKRDLNAVLEDGTLMTFESKHNIRIMITDPLNRIIYPVVPNYFEISTSRSEMAENVQYAEAITSSDNLNVLVSTITTNYQGVDYNLSLRSASFINKEEFSAIFFSILPYMIFLGLIISAIISYFFSRATSKKITRLNDIMSDMENLEYTALKTPIVGDEISDLENHIDQLYKRMIDEMNKIKKFEKDREVFMKGSIHELKTPLMVMSLHFSELLEDESLDEDIQLKLIELYQKTMHMNKLVSEVLKTSKLDSIVSDVRIKPIELMDEIESLYSYMMEDKKVNFIKSISDESIEMSQDDFIRVLSNLLSNAIKYSKEGSDIVLDFDLKTLTLKNTTLNTLDDSVDIFSPFTHSKDHEDSHGLGLYVVSMILNKYSYEYDYNLIDNEFTFTINFNKEP